jgi:hypothetical protein
MRSICDLDFPEANHLKALPLHTLQMGPKRKLEDTMDEPPKPQSSSPIMAMFEEFRSELDEHHDRRERIIKASRDITAASKKM